jgi:hypothetical protein
MVDASSEEPLPPALSGSRLGRAETASVRALWFEAVQRRPWTLVVTAFFVALALVRPFGNYPLNDDWQYARAARLLAETGHVVVDTDIAPSIVGQILISYPVLRLFGFSHTVLRLITIVLAVAGLWLVDALLQEARVPPRTRLIIGAVLAFNPLYFYLSTSYMTEIYGYVPALLAAWMWIRGRASRDATDGEARRAAVGWGPALSAAVVAGAAFWVRQYCALVFPALVGAMVARLAGEKRWGQLARTLPVTIASGAAWAIVLNLYFRWAKASGNFNSQFAEPFSKLFVVDAASWKLQPSIFVGYMSLFCAPILVHVWTRWGKLRWGLAAALGLALVGWEFSTEHALQAMVPPGYPMRAWLRPQWPFLQNIMFDAGIGPVTLADTQLENLEHWPHWPHALWAPLGHGVMWLAVLWGPFLVSLGPLWRTTLRGVRRDLFLFGLLWAGGSFVVVVQAYRNEVFDRYHFPGILGLFLVLGTVVAAQREATDGKVRWGAQASNVACGALLVTLSLFTVMGVHDYFRWNDARWKLVRDYLSRGGSATSLQAGYEYDGWYLMDATRKRTPMTGCRGRCECHHQDQYWWYCRDDSYQIAMGVLPGYSLVQSIAPSYWLAKGDPVSLSARK